MNVEKFALMVSMVMMSIEGMFGIRTCPSPQYLELGRIGIVRCAFQENVFAVYWYNSTNVRQDDAIVILQESIRSGKGFHSGLFDIYANGSLIINNVTYNHEGTFVVLKVETPSTRPSRYDIEVFVIAKTFSRIPLIAKCDKRSEVCLQDWNHNEEVTCYIRDARSLIPLNWNVRAIDEDMEVEFNFTVTNTTNVYTSRVTTRDPFSFTSLLTLLVCKADNAPAIMKKNESLILLRNERIDLTNEKVKTVYSEIGEKLTLNCSNIRISYLVWQFKNRFEENIETVLHAVLAKVYFAQKYEEYFSLESTGALVINVIRVKHEGVYSCIVGNGKQDDITLYDVFVHVTPKPAHPIVEGCTHEQYCVLEVENEGTLTCAVNNIRPAVTLDMKVVDDKSSNAILFIDMQRTIIGSGEAFDVSLHTQYRVTDSSSHRITIECTVVGEYHQQLDPSTKFDLLLSTGVVQTSQRFPGSILFWLVIILSAVVLLLVLLGICVMIACFKRRSSTTTKRVEAEQALPLPTIATPLLEKETLKDKKDVLIDQLKSKYADLYDAVLPIPYLRDMLYSVEGIFVEGGIEYLEPTNSKGGRTRWRPLKSYQNILNDVKVKSVRRFVEGEPGFGKSMLTLKFAYDWCNESEASPLQNVDILILLRLRQLGGVPSIYTAIKQLLLPKDTRLTTGDIKDILSNSSSVVFMLDGFDELPVLGSDSKSDIINIITKKMFNQFETILTTRSSCLPKEYSPQTIRLRLTGFDNRSRKEYILKAVAAGDKEAADHIRRRLKDNAVLAGVCQVPLFFVMFAHMSHENKHLQRFASVTTFFRHMVSCFHSHMKNKMRDENVTYYDINESDHQKLDKAAFEGLMAKRQQIVWKKVELLNRLGQEFYDQYVRMGILVEENVLHISDKPFAEHIRYETEVRFYHKIFCEWYAAHYLVEILSSENITFNKGFDFFGVDKPYWDSNPIEDKHCQGVNKDNDLGEINPFDVQYLYRFSCGLSSTAGKQIIESLQKNKEHEKYTLLCILELEGEVRKVIQTVKQLCSTPTEIKAGDTILLQESCIELLKIASQHEIPISCVHLAYRCFRSVGENEESLHLVSGVQLPTLGTLQKIEIYDDGDLCDKAKDILHFSARCHSLTTLTFTSGYPPIILPQMFHREDIPSALLKRGCAVQWKYRFFDYGEGACSWRLNLETGKWEDAYGNEMTDDEYRQVTD